MCQKTCFSFYLPLVTFFLGLLPLPLLHFDKCMWCWHWFKSARCLRQLRTEPTPSLKAIIYEMVRDDIPDLGFYRRSFKKGTDLPSKQIDNSKTKLCHLCIGQQVLKVSRMFLLSILWSLSIKSRPVDSFSPKHSQNSLFMIILHVMLNLRTFVTQLLCSRRSTEL